MHYYSRAGLTCVPLHAALTGAGKGSCPWPFPTEPVAQCFLMLCVQMTCQRYWARVGLRFRVDYPLKDLWKLDLATQQWSEPEQHGTRPCVRTMTHGMARPISILERACKLWDDPLSCCRIKTLGGCNSFSDSSWVEHA